LKLTSEQVEIIAHEVIRRLEQTGSVRLDDRTTAVERVGRALLEDLQIEDRLNEEVREILRGHADQIDRQNIQYHEMFKLIKSKLVRERKLIL
jgi:hypothetical protein